MNHHVISLGPLTTRLWLASDKRWKWHTYEAGKRVLRSADDLAVAKRRAADYLRALRDGRTALLEADPATVSEFMAWRDSRAESPKMADGVARYLAHLAARGVRDIRIVQSDLERFAAAHGGPMSSLRPEDVAAYLDSLGVGPRRRNNVRATIVSLYRWARLQSLVPDGTTAPERCLAAKLEEKPVAIYSPEQFRALLGAAPEGWRLGLAIGGLAGLRSEEIAGLRWEDLLVSRKLILVRAEICKTGRRRLVPIVPALAKIIAASKPCEGEMVTPRDRIDNVAKSIRRNGAAWIKNGLRHSFGSYRTAQVKSVGQVALEMGNSESIVRRHYLEVVDDAAAKRWFDGGSIRPKKAK